MCENGNGKAKQEVEKGHKIVNVVFERPSKGQCAEMEREKKAKQGQGQGEKDNQYSKDLDFCWKGCLPSLLLIIMAFAEPPSQSMGEYD